MPHVDANIGEPGQTLLQLLRDGGVKCAALLSPQAWETSVALALRQGVAPLLHLRLQTEGALAAVPAPLADRIDKERRTTALENLRNYGEFRRIAPALTQAGIPMIPLKGLHLAELVYRDISLRPMSDLDILVPRVHLREALDALGDHGYWYNKLLAASEQAMSGLNEITLVGQESGICIDLHWGLNEIRGTMAESIQEIWRCARPARLCGTDTLVMPPELLLVHICAHFACANIFASDARALCDIAEIVQANPALDWAKVVDHGSRHGWTRGVAAALRLARDHLGVPVPGSALAALGGDTVDPATLADAIAQLFATSELPEGLATAPNLLALSGSASLQEKAGLLWRRTFPPRAELALLYGVPADSPRLPLYYALRVRDLARRYATGARALMAGDPLLAQTAARHVRLQRWITGE